MNTSNCSYCGILTTTGKDVCESCELFFPTDNQPPAIENADQYTENESSPTDYFDKTITSTVTNTSYVSRQANDRSSRFESSDQTAQPASESKCLRCGISVPFGQRKCFKCINKKFPKVKVGIVFAVLAALIGTFSFGYIYETVSPWGMFRKYAKATGADNSIVFENFSFKGDASIRTEMTGLPSGTVNTAGKLEIQQSNNVLGEYSFEMVYKKPNKMSIEFTQNVGAEQHTVFKQAFDGIRGWKYTNLPNQPVGYQDTDDGFGFEKMGMGLDDYDSLEFTDDKIIAEYGKENTDTLYNLKTFEVKGLQKKSESKVMISNSKKKNGKIDKSLLCFDQETGFLLGMLRKDTINDTTITSIILFDEYNKFPVKKESIFSVFNLEGDFVLIPSKTSFIVKPSKAGQLTSTGMSIIIQLNVKTLDMNVPIDDGIFVKSLK